MSMEALWERSLAGRLTALLFVAWDSSLIGRLLAGLARFAGQVFAGSFMGRVWYSDWPREEHLRQSRAGLLLLWLADRVSAVGQWAGPFLRRLWESSLLVGSYDRVCRMLQPYLGTSRLFQGLTGYAQDVALAPAEPVVRPTSPLVPVLGAFLGLLPLLPADFRLLGIAVLTPTTLMMAGIWGVALLWLGYRWMHGETQWLGSSALLPLIALLVVFLAATVQSVSPRASAPSLLIWLTGGLLFVLVMNLVRTSRDAAALLGPILVGASLMTVWAVYQWFVPPFVEEKWVDVATSGEIVRSFASMGNPNYLAEYMVAYLPLAAALWVQSPRRRLELAVPVLAMALSLVLTYSRGGWLAALFAFGLLVLLRARRLTVLLFLGALAAPLVAPASIIARFQSAFSTADTSNLYRLNLWRGVSAMLEKFWMLGAGLGAEAFAKVYQEFMLPEARAAHAHNTYLQMLAETGLLGLLAVLWTLLAVLRRTVIVGASPRRPLLIAAVPAALLGLLLHGLVEHIWYNPKLLFAFWAVAGIGMGLTLRDREDAAA